MEDLQQIPWALVLITSEILLGAVFGIVLLLMKFPAARHLGRLIFGWLAVVVTSNFQEINDLKGVALIAVATSIYLYSVTFFSQKSRMSILHLIPLLAGLGLTLLDEIFLHVFTILIASFYLLRLSLLLKVEAATRGFTWFQNPGKRIAWFRNFSILNAAILITLIFGKSEGVFVGIAVLLLLIMVVYQVFQESEFLTPIPIGNKYQKSTLTPEIKAAVLNKIEGVMEQEFYLRDDASLSNLAKELGVTTHHLSQVLNESLKIGFQDLIARYRIRRACQLLKDEQYRDVKIENIAAMVGYNSKSSFNAAFKKRTGVTPSDYRHAKDVRTYGETPLSERERPSNKDRAFSLNHVFKIKMNSDMIQHFFKIFSRNVKRNGLFSFLNVLGLTVGFTCSILIYLYVQDELSYDRSLPDSDRIYRIAWMSDNPQTRTPHPMAQAMVKDFPEVEQAVSLSPWYGPGLSLDEIRVKNVKTNTIFEEPDFYFADSTFFDVFKLKVLEGDKDALKKPFSLVITAPMAKKYFGDGSAIGKELYLNDMALAVSAVVEPMPEHSHFHFNGIIPYVTLKQVDPTSNWMTWADFGHFNYIRLKEGASHKELESKIPEWALGYIDVNESMKEIVLAGEERFELQPITSIHLNSHLRWELENNGNVLYVYILLAVLGFLILIAAINYTNLTTAKSIERAKEVGVRKTLGAISSNLSGQFYLESVIFSLVALIFSIFIVSILLDGFNALSGKQFQMTDLINVSFLIKALLVGVGVGVLAGFYPAVALSSFKPAEVLKGKLTTNSKGGRLRSALVVLQFTISAILISGSLIIYNQLQYMKDKDLGFDHDAVISLSVPTRISIGGVDLMALRTAQNRMEAISGVRSTALASSIPGGQFNQHPYFLRNNPEQRVDASSIMVDYSIANVLGFELAEGRLFDRSYSEDSLHNTIINEEMARQLGTENLIGTTIVQDASGREYESRIIGVIKDFHFQSLHEKIQPLIMSVQPLGAGHILVKVDGQQFAETISKIEKIYTENVDSELPFAYHFLDQELASLYKQEEQTLSILSIFSLVALVLASLGLLGMAIAILNQRIKEVGMRKILGASTGQIMRMILGQFMKLVGVAIIIGLPLSYLLMQSWIAEFSYRAPVGAMPFLGAVTVLLLVAIISVISAVSKITYSNPIEALRYE